MKIYLSLLLTGALIAGATSLAYGESQKSEDHAGASHKSRSSTHHRSSGSHRKGNSGSKTQSNVPPN
jgi:hypothetical protein